MPCGITFLGLSFNCLSESFCLGGYCSVREAVLCPSVHVAVYACISHLCEETSPPD